MTLCHSFKLDQVDPSWRDCLNQALAKMDPLYLNKLKNDSDWLPGHEKIMNAFSLPVNKINYILLGESPYPRAQSANGYAFWDAAVTDLWSDTGLSKSVNRATSLRNIIKMLLVANGLLQPNATSQMDITAINKQGLIKTNEELFNRFLSHGFLLLNTSLVLQKTPVRLDAKAWQPFIKYVLEYLYQNNPHVQLILLGNIANNIDKLIDHLPIKKWYSEHPYNISFILNPAVLEFFKPFNLLKSVCLPA